jgi:glucokinase
MIIAGDIGGTHTRMGTFSGGLGSPKLDRWQEFKSKDYDSMEKIVEEFLKGGDAGLKPEGFCFGVAGPVVDGTARPTNLSWNLVAAKMTETLGAPVSLINDLEANAYGVATLGPEDLVTLQEGAAKEHGNTAVIAAGTGLGEAGLFWDGSCYRPFASEGGHCTYSPDTAEQVDLLNFLRQKFPDHVSWERVLSGPGLYNVYQFFRDTGRAAEEPWLAEAIDGGDRAAVIADAAEHGKSELCEKTLNLFVSLYGSEAANLALKMLSVAGVYIGGGIAPRILGKLKEGPFLEAFLAKGRMRIILERMPIHVIMNDKTALQGAARRGMLAI